jgi:hypothetical protein
LGFEIGSMVNARTGPATAIAGQFLSVTPVQAIRWTGRNDFPQWEPWLSRGIPELASPLAG